MDLAAVAADKESNKASKEDHYPPPDDFEQTPMLMPLEASQSSAVTQKPMSWYSFLHKRRFSGVGDSSADTNDVGPSSKGITKKQLSHSRVERNCIRETSLGPG